MGGIHIAVVEIEGGRIFCKKSSLFIPVFTPGKGSCVEITDFNEDGGCSCKEIWE